MTIREKMITSELESTETRLQKLKEVGAPSVVIESLEKSIQKLKSGEIDVGGESQLLDEEYENGIVQKGRSGKPYISINDGTILYFPTARYGRFIKRADS